MIGQSLKDWPLPATAVIAAVIRDGQGAGTARRFIFEEGDEVLAVVDDASLDQMRALFGATSVSGVAALVLPISRHRADHQISPCLSRSGSLNASQPASDWLLGHLSREHAQERRRVLGQCVEPIATLLDQHCGQIEPAHPLADRGEAIVRGSGEPAAQRRRVSDRDVEAHRHDQEDRGTPGSTPGCHPLLDNAHPPSRWAMAR